MIAVDEGTFQQLFFRFRSCCRSLVGHTLAPSSDSDLLVASVLELHSLFPASANVATIDLACRLLLPSQPESPGGRASATNPLCVDFVQFITALDEIANGTDSRRFELIYLSLSEHGRKPLTTASLGKCAAALQIRDASKFTASLSRLHDPSLAALVSHTSTASGLILSQIEFVSILSSMGELPGIFGFVLHSIVEPAKAIAGSIGTPGLAAMPSSADYPSPLQNVYRHKEGFLFKHIGYEHGTSHVCGAYFDARCHFQKLHG